MSNICEKTLYLWVAQWRFYFTPTDIKYWTVYVSNNPFLKEPIQVAAATGSERWSYEEMYVFIDLRKTKGYNFIIIEHPDKLETPFKFPYEQRLELGVNYEF